MVEGNDTKCVLCLNEEESISHLFNSCKVSSRIWQRVHMWLGISDVMSIEEFKYFFHILFFR